MQNAVQNRTWLGSIAAAIKALMGMLINLIRVADEGIAMADKAVTVAREKQAIDLTISNKNYAKNALKLAAMEQSKIHESVEDYITADKSKAAARKQAVAEAYVDLETSVEEELAKIRANRTKQA